MAGAQKKTKMGARPIELEHMKRRAFLYFWVSKHRKKMACRNVSPLSHTLPTRRSSDVCSRLIREAEVHREWAPLDMVHH